MPVRPIWAVWYGSRPPRRQSRRPDFSHLSRRRDGWVIGPVASPAGLGPVRRRSAKGAWDAGQGHPPIAWAAAAVLGFTTTIDAGGTNPERPVTSPGSIMTSHVQTTAAFLVRPVFGCLVPGGFLYGNRLLCVSDSGKLTLLADPVSL